MAQITSNGEPTFEVRELYDHAMMVERPRDAQRIFSSLVMATMQEATCSQAEAVDRVKQNLGYLAGYHSHDTRRRVETLFRCVHPYLGPAEKTPPTPEECFEAGARAAQDHLEVKWKQPTDNVPPDYKLLLENVYQFREMLDHCYDHIDVLKGKLKSLEGPAARIKELEEENLRLRVSLKARALKTGDET